MDLMSDPSGSEMIILRNLEGRRTEATLHLPGLRKGKAVEQFGGTPLQLRKSKKGVTARIALKAGEVRVYRA